jgi:hypothetical protein
MDVDDVEAAAVEPATDPCRGGRTEGDATDCALVGQRNSTADGHHTGGLTGREGRDDVPAGAQGCGESEHVVLYAAGHVE